jgi:hypothetical protein
MCIWRISCTQVDLIDNSNLLSIQLSRLAECLGNIFVFRRTWELWPCSNTSRFIIAEIVQLCNFDASVDRTWNELIRKLTGKFIQTFYKDR